MVPHFQRTQIGIALAMVLAALLTAGLACTAETALPTAQGRADPADEEARLEQSKAAWQRAEWSGGVLL